MAKPRMCPHCRAFIESHHKTCPYCENDLPITAARRLAREERIQRMGAQVGFTTKMLLLVNAALFVASLIMTINAGGDTGFMGSIDGRVLRTLGAKLGPSILLQGEWWRLVTANFLHGGLMHLAFNGMSLFNLGPLAENLFGTSRFLVLWMLTGVCGFAVSTMWSDALSIGASASICGLIGAMYGYGRRNQNYQFQSVAKRWIIAIAVFGFLFPAIDNAAHVGGLAAGIGFGYLCDIPGRSADADSIWKGVSIGVMAVVVAAFFLAYRNFSIATA